MIQNKIPNSVPGSDLLNKGLEDLRSKKLTEESLLVLVGKNNLQNAGIFVPDFEIDGLPEHKLYNLLAIRFGNQAHSSYNALIGKLCSAERILAS